jgi:hypothetical protein
MNMIHSLSEKKYNFDTIVTTTNLGIVYILWEEKVGGCIYLHRMKIRLLFFDIALFFYQQYDILFHRVTNNEVTISDLYPVHHIYLHSMESNINSLLTAINNSTNPVFFSRVPWGKIMYSKEFNTLLRTNIQGIQCIEYSISPSFFLSTLPRKDHDIQHELEKEKERETIEQDKIAILSNILYHRKLE